MNFKLLPALLSILLTWAPYPIAGQSLTRAVGHSASDYYADLRKSLVSAYPEIKEPLYLDAPPNHIYELKDCDTPDLVLGIPEESNDWFPTSLAMDAYRYTTNLIAYQVPEHVWRKYINEINATAVDAIKLKIESERLGKDPNYNKLMHHAQKLDDTLLRDLNLYGAAHQKKFITADGCGAGEEPVAIRSRPPGAFISYIPLFFYKLCDARGIPPTNILECNGWVDVVKDFEYLSGKYVYIAHWPDGRSTSGIFMVDGEHRQVTITRRP